MVSTHRNSTESPVRLHSTESPVRLRPEDGLATVSGRRDHPLSDLTVPALLHRALRANPDGVAAVFTEQNLRLTWSQLADKVDQLAAGLLAHGFYKGDRIGIWAPNRYEWLLTQFATARIGVILVNINPAYRRRELAFALQKAGVKGLITAVAFKSSRYLDMLRDIAPELNSSQGNREAARLVCPQLPNLTTVVHLGESEEPGMRRFVDLMQSGMAGNRSRLNAISRSLSADDAINIQFTSGTTGSPKGATLTHRNIVNNAMSCARAMQLTQQDRLCIPVPLYHCFGMVLGNLACVSANSTMVFPGEAFDPKQTLVTLAKEQCTAIHGVPTMFVAMINDVTLNNMDLRQLRTGIMAGAPCPADLMRRVIKHMHLREMTIAYGMTETSPVSFQTSVDDAFENRVNTVGRIQPHVEAKVVDDKGRTVRVGETGELCTRGYLVMHGYWDDQERTQQVIDAQGWMHTGDLVSLDAQGYCRIVGRATDMIIRGGENVYPREVEEFLVTLDDVADVQVFGIPDDRLGEAVCAFVVPTVGHSPTVASIQTRCEGQIAHFKIPQHICIVDTLPMTVTGKPQKYIMRDQMMAALSQP